MKKEYGPIIKKMTPLVKDMTNNMENFPLKEMFKIFGTNFKKPTEKIDKDPKVD
jgi:hypothetical protein